MRTIFALLFFCCALFKANAQSNHTYQLFIAKAGLFHLQKDYKKAIDCYEKAFQIQQPDALNAYKAAGMYALANNHDKAFYYLQVSLDGGWTEADWLAADFYFETLQKTAADRWKAVVQNAYFKEEQYAKSLQLAALRKEINLMTLKDQQLRFKRAQVNNDSLSVIINREINQSDFDNLNRAKKIIQEYGWPKISQIGKDGQNNLWLIVQHADQDVDFQRSVLGLMEKLRGTKELQMENYAFLYDRVQCNLNNKQFYGTQVVWTSNGQASAFKPILKEYLADERRIKIGLQPLEIYALTYGFDYKKVTLKESNQKDMAYSKQVELRIENAKNSYKNNEFQKVYDFYNDASTFLGGMTSEDNFTAAVIFSEIAAKDSNNKYKSIALDFLDLLYLRKYLTKAKLKHPAFTILYKEARWNKIAGTI